MSAVPLPMPATDEYEVILRGLSDDELHATIEALRGLTRRTDENERMCLAIVRELSIREAYIRVSQARHPAARGGTEA